jgi:hypothetical protein
VGGRGSNWQIAIGSWQLAIGLIARIPPHHLKTAKFCPNKERERYGRKKQEAAQDSDFYRVSLPPMSKGTPGRRDLYERTSQQKRRASIQLPRFDTSPDKEAS